MNKPEEVSISDNMEYRSTLLQQAAASCTGAVITSFLVTPLDVVKIRLQVQQKNVTRCFLYCNGLMDHICGCNPNETKPKMWYNRPSHFNGTIDAFVKISRNEGMASLWSGLSPTLILAIPATIVYFVSYEQLKVKLKSYHNRYRVHEELPMWIPLVSGATARIVSATVVSPLELVRTKMQSAKFSYLEISHALKFLIQHGGVKSLWKGVVPTLLRDVPFSALYWTNYERIKSYGPATPSFHYSFMAGAISGAISAVVTLPFDVVKTHQQIELGERFFGDERKIPHTTTAIIRRLYAQYGYRGLFAGLVPRVVKVAPACAIMIATFEYGKVFFNRLAQKNEDPNHAGDNLPSKKSGIVDLNVTAESLDLL